MGRKEKRTNKRVQILGLYIQRKSHGLGKLQRNSEESKEGSGMSVGNRREKVER
jgi:hypothetical protein